MKYSAPLHIPQLLERKTKAGLCCSVLQCGAWWCIVVQCVALYCRVLQCVATCPSWLRVVQPVLFHIPKLLERQAKAGLCNSVLQCVAVCCSVCCSVCWNVCCSVLQRVVVFTVCCSVLLCVAVRCSVLHCVALCCTVLQCSKLRDISVVNLKDATGICENQRLSLTTGTWLSTECCNVLQSVAMCCRVLQCVAECCRVLQHVAVRKYQRPFCGACPKRHRDM